MDEEKPEAKATAGVANIENRVDDNVGDDVHESDEIQVEEDEDECRVCRGPAEEGRPLFSPCKCSGSIGLTHQDCLSSWLEVTRGEGRCELCKAKFHFAPQYADGAPENLGIAEVVLGLGRRAVALWLPFLLRLLFCLSLWLVAAPLVTAYVYLIWMNRSISCVQTRWTWHTLPRDIVSGGYLVGIILLSFLSLMSFADFLRVEWQQQQQHGRDHMEPDTGRRLRRELVDAAEENRRRRHEVDNFLLERLKEEREVQQNSNQSHRDGAKHSDADYTQNEHDVREPPEQELEQAKPGEGNGSGHPNNEGLGDGNGHNGTDDRDVEHDDDNNDNDGNERKEENDDANLPANHLPRQPREDAGVDDPPFGGENMNLDDQVDLELQVALDELLGVRGPISVGIRNLLWLLLFNTFYLFFFAFIPKSIGSSVFSGVANVTASFDNVTKKEIMSIRTAVTRINQRSLEEKTIFRVPDFAAVNLGYLFGALLVIIIRVFYVLINKCSGESEDIINNHRVNRRPLRREDENRAGAAAVLNEAERLIDAMDDQDGRGQARLPDGLEPAGIGMWKTLGLLLDAAVSVVKVGVLLFLKMFLLPVILGVWLDVSSMELLGRNLEDSLSWAGKDLLSTVLLHWVAGITFMLLVTVSVLQLREVAHPGLLAHLIRPQEPQPDLLGNLMHDSVITQTKRMLLSLGIYSALLQLFVSLPAKLLTSSRISKYLGFLKLKFWNILMPQLQVPIELVVFHLCMLALLERHKNHLGELQHHWLVFICSRLGLTSYILPQDIDKFVFCGSIRVLSAGKDEGNNVIYKLAQETIAVAEREALINASATSSITEMENQAELLGETRGSGERVLNATQAYISLPAPHSKPCKDKNVDGRSRSDNEGIVLLPTSIGRFRLKRREDTSKEAAIEIWQEHAGKPIPRPPEGWDDLGAGGALEGRWAWATETASAIEHGVAQRSSFFGTSGESAVNLATLFPKLLLLLFFSWCATTAFLMAFVSAPLGLGRLAFLVLRVPVKFVHDPWSYAVGSFIALPLVASVGNRLNEIDAGNISRDLRQWTGSVRLPPFRKAGVIGVTALLWLFVGPLALGLIYELCFVISPSWFTEAEDRFNLKDFAMSWIVGSVLLNTWAGLCGLNFFTLDFWATIGNGMIEGEDRRARQEAQQEHGVDGTEGPIWQGRDGRVARFLTCMRTAMFGFDWEKVDHVLLLAECAFPVSKTLCMMLVGPSLCYVLWFWSMDAVFGYQDFSGSYRLYVFRLASVSSLLVQLCIAFQKKLQRWFGAVHKTARDDRYLVGEILLNYRPDIET